MTREWEHIAKCRSCGAEIVWLRTKSGNNMPVDAETVDHNDYMFDPAKHRSHFATCPDADEHRTKR